MAESADFLINRRPAAGILLRVSCIFVADGVKTEDLLEVEPLVCRMRSCGAKWCFENRIVEFSVIALPLSDSFPVRAYCLFAQKGRQCCESPECPWIPMGSV